MKLTTLTNEQLLKKKVNLLEQLKKTPKYCLTRKDLYKALEKIEKERLRRKK